MAPGTTLSENEEKEFGDFLRTQIREFNNSQSDHHRAIRQPGAITPLNLIVKDEAGNVIGGLAASTYWEWLDIDNFFLPQALRGRGLGASLLQTAETIAIERGCKRCFLTTFDFQARALYEKHGYYVIGTLADYPPGSAYFWMRKDLQMTTLDRTKANPWMLKTPPGTAEYTMHVEERDGQRVLICTVGSTVLLYDARCVDDLHAMLKQAGGWVELGGADEQKPAKEGTVEAWGRSPDNPIGGWYGLKKGLRGRFGVYLPPLMEALGLCELEHHPKNNRMRAK